MIIKNYSYPKAGIISNTPGPALGATLHILENVSDVVVHLSSFQGNLTNGPYFEGPAMPVVFIEHAEPSSPSDAFYFVDFTDTKGVRSRLKVTAYAYLCNDQGKTVEKIGC